MSRPPLPPESEETVATKPGPSVTSGADTDRNRGATPYPFITPLNAATAALGLYISTITAVGFVVACTVAPTASQANTTYAFAYTMIR